MSILQKLTGILLLLALAPASLFADPTSRATIDKAIGILAHLDAEYRVVQASTDSPGSLKRYEIELQKAANVFFSIANAEQQRNPDMSEAAGVTGRLIFDSAYIIYVGLEKKNAVRDVLAAHAKKIAFLPSIYLGVILPLHPSKAKPDGLLTQEELKSLHDSIVQKFGDKITGPKSINGDNSFAQAASLTEGFVKALRK